MMKVRIENSAEKKFIGKRLKMSFSDNKTFELWSSFMPRRKEISNSTGKEFYSIEIYKPAFFENFNPDNIFEKWAAVEVTDFQSIPEGMEKPYSCIKALQVKDQRRINIFSGHGFLLRNIS